MCIYMSLLISLLTAFVAMLWKQWVNRYLQIPSGSMIERCRNRQRKCDGLGRWKLDMIVGSLLILLQAALLLLACGLCLYTWTINTSVARVLIGLTTLTALLYLWIAIVGTLSYNCPFQTPVSFMLRYLMNAPVSRNISSIISKLASLRAHQARNQNVRSLLRRQSLQTTTSLEDVQVRRPESWLTPGDRDIVYLDIIDARCVSWILKKITDPEALDAAVRLAGAIRWFDRWIPDHPPYGLIACMFDECFDSTGKLCSGSRDKAYYYGQAMVWTHTLAMCKSEEFASTFGLPNVRYTAPNTDPDLEHLLLVNDPSINNRFVHLLRVNKQHTPSHSEWASNILLHLAWANRTRLDFEFILDRITGMLETTVPLSAALNRLLVWCILLGWPVEEEALGVQDKSYGIPCFQPSSCSRCSSPVVTWNASYFNYLQQSFQPSAGPILNVDSSRTCYAT